MKWLVYMSLITALIALNSAGRIEGNIAVGIGIWAALGLFI